MLLVLACTVPTCPRGEAFTQDGLCAPLGPATGTDTATDTPPTCDPPCGEGSVCCAECCPLDPAYTCVEGDACPQPDLLVDENRAAQSLVLEAATLAEESCAVLEGCALPGDRRLLRFTTVTPNAGAAPLVLGVPTDDPRFTWSYCHSHFHYDGYMDVALLDGAGAVLVGQKQAFCLMDSEPWNDPAPGPVYFCGNQGISPGWADTYAAGLDCQWLDVTDVAPGAYTLRLTVDPEERFPEADESNNSVEIPVALP